MTRAPLLLLLLAGACSKPWNPEWQQAVVDLSLPEGRVLDPRLDGAPDLGLRLSVTEVPQDQACAASLRLLGVGGQERTLQVDEPLATGVAVDQRFDGRDDDGQFFDPGPVDVVATLTCDGGVATSARSRLYVVRLGVTEVNLQSPEGEDSNVVLAWHKATMIQTGVTEITPDIPEYRAGATAGDLADLDENDGTPRPSVEPWTNPDQPPWGAGGPTTVRYNAPAAFVAGAPLGIVATLGTTAVSARSGVAAPALGPEAFADEVPAIRLVPDALIAVDPDATALPGSSVAFEVASPGSSLGKTTLALTWRFQAEEPRDPDLGDTATGTVWHDVPGSQTTSHVVYLLYGQPALRDGTDIGAAPPIPWIGTLEDTWPSLSGAAPEVAAVLDGLRDYIHYNEYVMYNPGDGAYSGYQGPYMYWEYTWSNLSDWLDRDNGVDLYCHSVSCLFSVLAGTWGVEAPQQVLGTYFRTNLVRAAGDTEWYAWSFNSHSVISPDGGATLWDASIAMDGDEDPSTQPVTEIQPRGLSWEEYTWRLSYDPLEIINSGLCYVY